MALSQQAKKMICIVGLSQLVFVGASAMYYRSSSFLPFALGVLLSSSLNMVKIIMLDRTVAKALGGKKDAAANYVRLQYLLRFSLTAAVLAAAVFIPFVSLWGAAAGLLTLQIAAYATKYLHNGEGHIEG